MATKEEIQYHYDLDNDFFKIFLDKKYMQYSCGLWNNDSTLEQLQMNKLSRIFNLAKSYKCKNLLDIGCGWGGAMNYAYEHMMIESIKGITLSEKQFHYINENNTYNSIINLESWEELKENNYYDTIISVGAFEHFASQEDKFNNMHIEKYRNFFIKCSEVSTKNSYLGLQTIVTDKLPRTKTDLSTIKFLLNQVFPGSIIPTYQDILKATEGIYEIEEKFLIGKDYSRTLKNWKDRLLDSKLFIVDKYGKDIFQFYLAYFNHAISGFDKSFVNLLQISLRKI